MNRRYQDKNQPRQKYSHFYQKNFLPNKPTTLRPRLNRRFIARPRRNRLQRVQNVINNNYQSNFKHQYHQRPYNANNVNNNFNGNKNYVNNNNTNREIFVKGLPRHVDDKALFNLFKGEGRIIRSNILYDNVGFSRGIGRILFNNFRDAMNVIKKWNNTEYKGNVLKVEYKAVKNKNNRNNNAYNKFANNNNNGNSAYNGINGYNGRNNNYSRQLNFKQTNYYSTKFRPSNNFNNSKGYYNNGYNRYRSLRNNNVNY